MVENMLKMVKNTLKMKNRKNLAKIAKIVKKFRFRFSKTIETEISKNFGFDFWKFPMSN